MGTHNVNETSALRGTGTIVADGEQDQIPVSFEFIIVDKYVEGSGFPRALAERHSRGTVTARNGRLLPEGKYLLTFDDSGTQHVMHVGGEWRFIS